MWQKNKHIGELLLLLSGMVLLFSLLVIFLTGGFLVWGIAKALYAFGVVAFLFNK